MTLVALLDDLEKSVQQELSKLTKENIQPLSMASDHDNTDTLIQYESVITCVQLLSAIKKCSELGKIQPLLDCLKASFESRRHTSAEDNLRPDSIGTIVRHDVAKKLAADMFPLSECQAYHALTFCMPTLHLNSEKARKNCDAIQLGQWFLGENNQIVNVPSVLKKVTGFAQLESNQKLTKHDVFMLQNHSVLAANFFSDDEARMALNQAVANRSYTSSFRYGSEGVRRLYFSLLFGLPSVAEEKNEVVKFVFDQLNNKDNLAVFALNFKSLTTFKHVMQIALYIAPGAWRPDAIYSMTVDDVSDYHHKSNTLLLRGLLEYYRGVSSGVRSKVVNAFSAYLNSSCEIPLDDFLSSLDEDKKVVAEDIGQLRLSHIANLIRSIHYTPELKPVSQVSEEPVVPVSTTVSTTLTR